MSTPPPPGQPDFQPQQYGYQPPPQQPGQPSYGQSYPFTQSGQPSPPMQPPKKQRNVIGAIALGAAILGFIFACIPGALVVGWVLLPIAFILGIVGLVMSNRTKGTSIAAVIVSIIGTIVGVVVFLTLVGDAFDDAFNGDGEVTVSEQGGDATAPADTDSDSDAKPGSRENPASIGATITSGDWEVAVNTFTPNGTQQVLDANSFNDEPDPGFQYAVVNMTVTYRGDDSSDASMVAVAYVTEDGNVFSTFENSAVAPEPKLSGELYNGASLTGNDAILIPQNKSGLLRLRLGMLGDEVFVTTN